MEKKKKRAVKKVEEKVEKPQVQIIEVERPQVPDDFKIRLNPEQIQVIKDTVAKGASDTELQFFLYIAERTGLDPFTKQIHLVPIWDSKVGREVRQPITGIDGYRSTAERTGNYAGNDDPVFDNEQKPTKATVTVYKVVQGLRVPFTATARWDQYVGTMKDKQTGQRVPNPTWQRMPHLMLGKCAEALALRKAFPMVLSGLYIAEEMQHAQEAKELPQDDYAKAQKMIEQTTNGEALETVKPKILGSDKYTADQKETLAFLIDERVAKLKGEKAA